MGQQIPVETALAAFRKRVGELADENVLLRAHIDVLEAEVEKLRADQPSPPDLGQQAAPDQSYGSAGTPV